MIIEPGTGEGWMPRIRDILPPGADVWAKADFGWRWEGHVPPFIAYGKRKVADSAAERMKEGDLVLIVRVTDPVKAKGKPGLIEGALQVKPSDRRPTASYLPADVIQKVEAAHGRQWPFAVGGTRTWAVLGERNALNVMPKTRQGFSLFSGQKAVSPVLADELEAVLNMEVQEVAPSVAPGVSAILAASKRRLKLAAKAAPDLYKQLQKAGLLLPESAHEQAAHAETGRHADLEIAAKIMEAQGDACTLCGFPLALGRLAPVALIAADGTTQLVHLICRALQRHSTGQTYAEGARKTNLKSVGKPVAERNGRVPLIALGANIQRNGKLVCEVCEHDWASHAGVTPDIVSRLFEVHHERGVSEGEQHTDPLKDVWVLCALCHKLAHP